MKEVAILLVVSVSLILRSVGELFIRDVENEFTPIERYSSDISWYAPFHSGGGYSSEAIAFVKALDLVGIVNFTITHHGDSWNRDFVENMVERDRKLLSQYEILYKSAGYPRISICHSEPGAWYTPNPKYHTTRCPNSYPFPGQKLSYYKIGRTMFETDRLPTGWADRLNFMDEIWVPTEHMRTIMLENNVLEEKVHVVAEAVDTDFFSPQSRRSVHHEKHQLTALRRLPDDFFVFLFVGKFEARKGLADLMEAYVTEFSKPHDNVVLAILTGAYHSDSNFEEQVQRMLEERGIEPKWSHPNHIILQNVHSEAMPALYSYADVLVIPSHGEGWGRPHMEAMACGTPVIATNWSGPPAFMDDSTGYLIEIEDELVDAPGWPGHRWAQPKVSHLRELMRHVYNEREEVREKGERARAHMVEHYSLPVMGEVLLREFDRVLRKVGARPALQEEESDLLPSSAESENPGSLEENTDARIEEEQHEQQQQVSSEEVTEVAEVAEVVTLDGESADDDANAMITDSDDAPESITSSAEEQGESDSSSPEAASVDDVAVNEDNSSGVEATEESDPSSN